MLKPRVLSALCAAAGLTLSSGGAQAEVAPVVDTDFAKMCRGEATAEQVQRLRHHFHTRKTRSVLDRALWRALSQHCGLDVVDMLLGAGASPNAKGERGVTPLTYALLSMVVRETTRVEISSSPPSVVSVVMTRR